MWKFKNRPPKKNFFLKATISCSIILIPIKRLKMILRIITKKFAVALGKRFRTKSILRALDAKETIRHRGSSVLGLGVNHSKLWTKKRMSNIFGKLGTSRFINGAFGPFLKVPWNFQNTEILDLIKL